MNERAPVAGSLAAPPDRIVIWRRVSFVLGTFCLGIWLLLLVEHFRLKANDPLNSTDIAALQSALRTNPRDEAVKEQIRGLDQHLRQRYFRNLALTNSGGWLLFFGAVGFLVAAKGMSHLRFAPYLPLGRRDAERLGAARLMGRKVVGGIGMVIVTGGALLAFSSNSKLPRNSTELARMLAPAAANAVAIDTPSAEEWRRNWPQFRGPTGAGLAFATNLPVRIDTNQLAWKVEVPVRGYNSPVVWDNRVFLSGGDSKQREVLCYDLTDGKLLWRRPVAIPSSHEPPDIPDMTGWAAPTMATDGRRVYAIFGNNDLAALTMEGAVVWSTNLGPASNQYGHAASLALWQDKLIVQLDQGEEKDRMSKLYAFDGASGKVAWQRPRSCGASWTSPIAFEANGTAQIVALALPLVTAYSARDGTELWRVDGLLGEITPSPAWAAGLLFAVGPSDKLLAIRPDGTGDVTKSHLAWSFSDDLPEIASPVANDEFVFMISSSGKVTCLDAKAGAKLWEHEYEEEFFASPIIAGSHVYLVAKPGALIVIEAAREFREVAHSELGDEVQATPAFVNGRIVFRTEHHLFCAGPETTQLAKP